MTVAAERDLAFRPYAPSANVVSVLQRLRRMNTPPRLTSEFLGGAGVSEALRNRVLAAMRFLELIDDEQHPSDTLRSLVVAPDEDYRKLLEATLRSAYREDFENVDPTTDPQIRILNAFQRYQPRSQHERQVMLFLGLCREAGISVLDAPRERQMHDTAKRGIRSQRHVSAGSPKQIPGPSTQASVTSPANGLQPPATNSLLGLVGLVEQDAEILDEAEFEDVWQALGTVVGTIARARGRAKQASASVVQLPLDEAVPPRSHTA